jgi:hypothetical protein
MKRFQPCTEEIIALAKSLTDSEIEELIEQIYRHERPSSDYWGIMYVRDLWAVGIEPTIAPPDWRIVARFGEPFAAIPQNWESRKSGEYVPYVGEEAEIEEYKLANQNKAAEVQPEKDTTGAESRHPKSAS